MGIDFNVDKLLEPYEEGGTPVSPVKRSLATISNALVNRDNIPPDVAGAAIWKVFYAMAREGLEFKGDGSYGSKGAELFSCIKAQCVDTVQRKTLESVKEAINEMAGCTLLGCPKRTKVIAPKSRLRRVMIFLLRPRGLWRL